MRAAAARRSRGGGGGLRRRLPCPTHLERPREDVAVVRQARGEGRAVVEDVLGLPLGAPQLLLERVDGVPERERLLLALGERELLALGDVLHGGGSGREAVC